MCLIDVKIYDTYDFNGNESANILNKFGYYFEKKGQGTVYDWSATYTQTLCGHSKKSWFRIPVFPAFL